MSTSLLYHGFGMRDYRYVKTDFSDGGVIFTVRRKRKSCRCTACGSTRVWQHGEVTRRFRTLPMGNKPVFVEAKIPRLACRDCHRVRQAEAVIADPRRTFTKSFERYVLELSRHMTVKAVAFHLGVSWDVVKDIQKRYLKGKFAKPKLKHLRQIAIDEISTRKGHRYLTLVLDLESGAVVFVGQGKGAAALTPFWKRLRCSGADVEAVAMDLSRAYIQAVETHLPEAVIVFDRFHIVKLFNEKLTQLRRELFREATDALHKNVLKGTRWLLLKHPDNLDEERNERQRLEEALRLNQPLATAYYLKEDLRQLWEQPHKTAACNFFTSWYLRAMNTGIRLVQEFARTLMAHVLGIYAWYDHPISTGPLEGTNNKIKTMRRQAYGFRDPEFFRLKILGIHETTYALVG
jgi:transposase